MTRYEEGTEQITLGWGLALWVVIGLALWGRLIGWGILLWWLLT